MDSERSTSSTIAVICGLIAAVIVGGIFMLTKDEEITPQKFGEIQSASCTAMNNSVVSIGNQSSVLVVASTSNRASLHIQQPLNATNTVYFNFSYASATVANGTWILESASTTGTAGLVRELIVGKQSLFPYSGPITARASSGSTTILVTECIY